MGSRIARIGLNDINRKCDVAGHVDLQPLNAHRATRSVGEDLRADIHLLGGVKAAAIHQRQSGVAPGHPPLYFSFVIGMTAQVSDVGITDKTIRRTATAHGVISFIYNTALVALMVKIPASAI